MQKAFCKAKSIQTQTRSQLGYRVDAFKTVYLFVKYLKSEIGKNILNVLRIIHSIIISFEIRNLTFFHKHTFTSIIV